MYYVHIIGTKCTEYPNLGISLCELVHRQVCQVEENEKRKCLIYTVVGC